MQQSDAPGGPILQRGVRLLPLLLLQVDGMEVAVLQGWWRLHQSTMWFYLYMPTIFDMRDDFSSEGSIRVVTHYIAHEDEKVGEIRAVVTQVDEDVEYGEPVSIIIDSGADAPIFPSG